MKMAAGAPIQGFSKTNCQSQEDDVTTDYRETRTMF